MSTTDSTKFLKEFEKFLEGSTVNLGRTTKAKEKFVKQAMKKLTDFIEPVQNKSKKVQIPNKASVICFKPDKDGKRKGGSHSMTERDSTKVDEMRKGR